MSINNSCYLSFAVAKVMTFLEQPNFSPTIFMQYFQGGQPFRQKRIDYQKLFAKRKEILLKKKKGRWTFDGLLLLSRNKRDCILFRKNMEVYMQKQIITSIFAILKKIRTLYYTEWIKHKF